MSRKRTRAPSPPFEDIYSSIFRSGEVEERGSTFVGVFSASVPAKQLQKLPDFKGPRVADYANHKIAAWRKPSRQRSIVPNAPPIMETGHDDDGEQWAGKRLEKVLNDLEVEGSVVVARWMKGGNIGPVRFTHMETVAKQAVQKFLDAVEEGKQSEARKRKKVEEEAALHRLRNRLRARDQNIATMRQLLADKTAFLADTDPVPPTPSKTPDYDTMEKPALDRINKARDASVTFILAKLEDVDKKLEAAGKPTKLPSKSPQPDRIESTWKKQHVENAKNKDPSSPKTPDDGTTSKQEDQQPENLQSRDPHSADPPPGSQSTTEDEQPLPPNAMRLTTENPSFQTLSFSETMTWVDTPGSSITALSSQSGPTKPPAD